MSDLKIKEDEMVEIKEGNYYEEMRGKLRDGDLKHGVVRSSGGTKVTTKSPAGQISTQPLPKPDDPYINAANYAKGMPQGVKDRIKEILGRR